MSNLIIRDPFTQLMDLQKQIIGDDWMALFKGVSIPTTDVYTKDNQLKVEAHLPNFSKDDITISLENNALVISAKKHETEKEKNKKYVVHESSSSFYRRISIPERAEINKIKAEFDDGALKVNIPLTPLPEPKKIAITASSKKK